MLEWNSEHEPEKIRPFWPEIELLLKQIIDRNYDEDPDSWIVYGGFLARIHKIVKRGFAVSFETAIPESVPEAVNIRHLFPLRPMSWRVAVQVFRNSGINGLDADSKKSDLLRALGPMTKSGGGNHPTIGLIPDWMQFVCQGAEIHFSFRGDEIETVIFLSTPASKRVDALLKQIRHHAIGEE